MLLRIEMWSVCAPSTAASPDDFSKGEATVRSTYWASDTRGPRRFDQGGFIVRNLQPCTTDRDDGQVLKPLKSQTFIL